MADRSFDQLHLGRTTADGTGKAHIRNHDPGPGHARYGPGVVDDEDQHCAPAVLQGLQGVSPWIGLRVFQESHAAILSQHQENHRGTETQSSDTKPSRRSQTRRHEGTKSAQSHPANAICPQITQITQMAVLETRARGEVPALAVVERRQGTARPGRRSERKRSSRWPDQAVRALEERRPCHSSSPFPGSTAPSSK